MRRVRLCTCRHQMTATVLLLVVGVLRQGTWRAVIRRATAENTGVTRLSGFSLLPRRLALPYALLQQRGFEPGLLVSVFTRFGVDENL